MKEKEATNFWLGFVLASSGIVLLYWWWQRQREVAPQPLIIARRPSVVPPEPRERAVDDLQLLHGIGPVYARRLNAAGIQSFAELAATGPEKLRAITKVTSWDPAEWIAEAGRLAQSH